MNRSVDHLGQEFPSFSAMASHWGHPRARVLRRLQRGRTLEQALTTPEGHRPPKSCKWVKLADLAKALNKEEAELEEILSGLEVSVKIR